MPTLRTATVVPQGPPGDGGFGHRNDVNIRSMFRSPLGTTYSEEAVRNAGVAALNGGGGGERGSGGASIYGGGGGSANATAGVTGNSIFGGIGGGSVSGANVSGQFPAGGGGANTSTAGAGARGEVRVWVFGPASLT